MNAIWSLDKRCLPGDRSGGPRRDVHITRSGVEGLVRAGPGARCTVFFWTDGHTGPCVAAAGLWSKMGVMRREMASEGICATVAG